MCGIAGFIGEGDRHVLDRMEKQLKHRGPDASGQWLSPDGRVGLMQTRLAIIDLSVGGKQPMHSTDERYTVVFNGEIYNYQSLRAQLTHYPFKSQSDTEVILAAFSTWGPEAFARIDGMFAIALYDTHTCALYLVRDRAGKKPLYWTHTNKALVFGSELKALLEHPSTSRELDPSSVTAYLSRDYVPTPQTIFKNIHKLEPASYLTYTEGTFSTVRYWTPAQTTTISTQAEALEAFDHALSYAVRERLVADVPVGVFLSGGIDSSTIAYYASALSKKKIQTFSIGFAEKSFDESNYARTVAHHLGTEHHEHILSSRDALALVTDLPQVFDEPVADASVLPTLLLSQFTRESVTVALGGDGADELLLGYPTFIAEEYARYWQHLPVSVRNVFLRAASIVPTSNGYLGLDVKVRKFTEDFADDVRVRHLQWLGTFREDEITHIVAPDIAQHARNQAAALAVLWQHECPNLHGLNALSHLYLRTYLMDQVLVKVDRASMHHALEVRAPFLSSSVIDLLLPLPSEFKYKNRQGKVLLKTLMKDRLPKAITGRSKKGFAIPVAAWLRHDLKDLVVDTLSHGALERTGLFNTKEVSKLLEEHFSGTRNHGKKLWNLLVFQLWYEHYKPHA